MAKSIRILKAKTFVLSPKKRYLLAFDNRSMTIAQGQKLLDELNDMGIRGVGVALKNENGLQIVELPNKEKISEQASTL